jgi:hypothetical protein
MLAIGGDVDEGGIRLERDGGRDSRYRDLRYEVCYSGGCGTGWGR